MVRRVRTIQDIEKDLEQAQENLKPVQKERDRLVGIVNNFYDELIQYKLDNKLYRPISDLKQYANSDLNYIYLVAEIGNYLKRMQLFSDEVFHIDSDGHLFYSSSKYGKMIWSEKEKKYIWGTLMYDFLGFLEIDISV